MDLSSIPASRIPPFMKDDLASLELLLHPPAPPRRPEPGETVQCGGYSLECRRCTCCPADKTLTRWFARDSKGQLLFMATDWWSLCDTKNWDHEQYENANHD